VLSRRRAKKGGELTRAHCFSDSLVTDGSEMIRCEGSRDFSMSIIA
jgi:hypothetical protein